MRLAQLGLLTPRSGHQHLHKSRELLTAPQLLLHVAFLLAGKCCFLNFVWWRQGRG